MNCRLPTHTQTPDASFVSQAPHLGLTHPLNPPYPSVGRISCVLLLLKVQYFAVDYKNYFCLIFFLFLCLFGGVHVLGFVLVLLFVIVVDIALLVLFSSFLSSFSSSSFYLASSLSLFFPSSSSHSCFSCWFLGLTSSSFYSSFLLLHLVHLLLINVTFSFFFLLPALILTFS